MSILLKDKQYLIEPLFEIKEYTNVLENIKREYLQLLRALRNPESSYSLCSVRPFGLERHIHSL